MSVKSHIAVLLLLVYGKIFIGAISSPKTQEFLARDPLCPIEMNVILPVLKITQLPEEKRKIVFSWSSDIHSYYLEDPFSGYPDWIIPDCASAFFRSFHKSYLYFRRLRI
jgi:hypothetical protein